MINSYFAALTFMSWSVVRLSFQYPEQEEDKVNWTLSQTAVVHTRKTRVTLKYPLRKLELQSYEGSFFAVFKISNSNKRMKIFKSPSWRFIDYTVEKNSPNQFNLKMKGLFTYISINFNKRLWNQNYTA